MCTHIEFLLTNINKFFFVKLFIGLRVIFIKLFLNLATVRFIHLSLTFNKYSQTVRINRTSPMLILKFLNK